MKKVLFLASLAAMAMTSCTSESNEYVGDNTPKEIAFMPINQKATRGTGAILNGTFPTTSAIQVAAYDAQKPANFFDAATFEYDNGLNLWKCSTSKYWPLSPATINFLGYANFTGTSATWGNPNNASAVTLVMTDNKTEQNDLMYAVGQGKVTQAGNAMVIPEKVDMVFTHAQALLSFNVKASSASSITLKKITLNNAIYSGTLAIVNDNYNQTTAQAVTSATWTPEAPTATYDIYNDTYNVNTSLQTIKNFMVVPHPSATSFDSFTLTYAIGGNDYTYTFTPANRNLQKATKYVYDITFNLHEILIDASVTPWTDTTPINYVEVPTKEFTYVASTGIAGTYTLPSATAGTYTVSISGLPADDYNAVVGTGTGSFITAVSPSTNTAVAADATFNVSFTVSADAGKNQTVLIKNDEDATLFTLTIEQP